MFSRVFRHDISIDQLFIEPSAKPIIPAIKIDIFLSKREVLIRVSTVVSRNMEKKNIHVAVPVGQDNRSSRLRSDEFLFTLSGLSGIESGFERKSRPNLCATLIPFYCALVSFINSPFVRNFFHLCGTGLYRIRYRVRKISVNREDLYKYSSITIIKNDLPGSDPHLDNRVYPVHSTFSTKHERLAIECSRPEVQTNCIPGQKWRCERDGHRWRRHKCKYAAPPPRMSKKCACFTPNGVVYTRLESNDYDYVHRYAGFGRDRRPTDVYTDVARYFARRGKFNISISYIRDYYY